MINASDNPFTPKPPLADMPGGRMGFELSETGASVLNEVRNELIAEGEKIFSDEHSVFWMRHQFGDDRMLEGLVNLEEQTGVSVKEFIRHSFRYYMEGQYEPRIEATVDEQAQEAVDSVEIPPSPDNLKQDGGLRRHESGYQISLNGLRAAGIDPARVLYYRVTQPSITPKQEYY